MNAVWIDLDDAKQSEAKAALWKILCAIDGEFLPPLSSRNDTTTRALDVARGPSPEGPLLYFEQMRAQENVMVRDDGKWVGFMSIKPHHVDEAVARGIARSFGVLPAAPVACDYISTLGASPEHRGRGVARRLYRAVIEERDRMPARLRAPWLATRTWSTNDAHIALLARLGFAEIDRLPNHRGDGIDSVYFAKRV